MTIPYRGAKGKCGVPAKIMRWSLGSAPKDGVPAPAVLKLVEQNDLVLVSLSSEISAIRNLMERYQDAPKDFADACVVRMVELNPGSNVPILAIP